MVDDGISKNCICINNNFHTCSFFVRWAENTWACTYLPLLFFNPLHYLQMPLSHISCSLTNLISRSLATDYTTSRRNMGRSLALFVRTAARSILPFFCILRPALTCIKLVEADLQIWSYR